MIDPMREPVDVPSDLEADDALRAVQQHGGLLLERAHLVLVMHVRHLREERDALMDLNTRMHHELTARDLDDRTPEAS